jgi:hypothetical protein
MWVVVQLSNPAVGRALSRIAISVLDVAGLSAPSITEACLHTGVQEIRLATERFAAARTVAPAPATLRELYGALAPIAVLPAGGGDTVICPGRDHRVAAGDGVTLFGTPDELHTAGVIALRHAPAMRPGALRALGVPGHPPRPAERLTRGSAFRAALGRLAAASRTAAWSPRCCAVHRASSRPP